ncbi:unnamed protein product, partial [Iphiclides podalirius]
MPSRRKTQCGVVSKMHKERSVPHICQQYKYTPGAVNEIWENPEECALLTKAGKNFINNVLNSRMLEWFDSHSAIDLQLCRIIVADTEQKGDPNTGQSDDTCKALAI